MRRTIRVSLAPASIENAIKEITRFRQELQDKAKEITRRLAEIGLNQAQVMFTGAMYDGDNDVVVEVEETERGYKVVARGEAVCFIEFGAGVFYNGNEAYPGTRPAGVVGIGEYGQGKGKRRGWYYGDKQFTRGNPPAAAMFNASADMKTQVARIIREVFSS